MSETLEYTVVRSHLHHLAEGSLNVIPQLNNEFFSRKLITFVEHNAITNPYHDSYERASQLFHLILKNLKTQPESAGCIFQDLVSSLRNVDLKYQAQLLMDTLRQKQEEKMPPLEYKVMDENYSKLVEQLRKRVTAIEQLSSRLYKAGIIPRRTFSDITLGNKSISEKAEILMSSTVEYLKFGPSHDSNGRFSQVIMSFKESKLTPIAEILTNSLGKYEALAEIKTPQSKKQKGTTRDQEPAKDAHEGQEPHDDNMEQFHKNLAEVIGKPTPIKLSSKEVVILEMEKLHRQFSQLTAKIMSKFDDLISEEKTTTVKIAREAQSFLQLSSPLSSETIDHIFTGIRPHYNFFDFSIITHLVSIFFDKNNELQVELSTYEECVEKFSESSRLKDIRIAIKKLAEKPDEPTMTIELKDRWLDITFSNFKKILHHYFGRTSNLFSRIHFDFGSIIVTLNFPLSFANDIIESVKANKESMARLGIEVVNVAVSKEREIKDEVNSGKGNKDNEGVNDKRYVSALDSKDASENEKSSASGILPPIDTEGLCRRKMS